MAKLWDELYELPTEGRYDDPLVEARYLGVVHAETSNKIRTTGVCGSAETNRMEYARERLDAIREEISLPALDAYNAGFHDTYDPTANSDWRNELPDVPCAVAIHDDGSVEWQPMDK